MSAFSFQLRRERSVVEVINATFEFVRLNASVLGKTLLYIVAPIGIFFATLATALISAIDWGVLESGSFEDLANNVVVLGGIIGAAGLFLLLFLVGSVLILVATMSIVELSERQEPGAFDLSDVWSRMKTNLLGLFVLMVISFAALYIPYIILSLASVFGLLLYFVYWMYVQPTLSLMYAAYVIERKSGVNAIRRAHELAKRGFGATLGLYVLISFLSNTLAAATALPGSAIAGGIALLTGGTGREGLVFTVVLATVYGLVVLASLAISSFLHIAMGLQYFHLVEKGDHTGLRQKVDALADGIDLDDPAAATVQQPSTAASPGNGTPASGENGGGESGTGESGGDAEAHVRDAVRDNGSGSEPHADGESGETTTNASPTGVSSGGVNSGGDSGNGAETSGKTAPANDASRWGRPSSPGDGNGSTGDARDDASGGASPGDAASDEEWTPPARS